MVILVCLPFHCVVTSNHAFIVVAHFIVVGLSSFYLHASFLVACYHGYLPQMDLLFLMILSSLTLYAQATVYFLKPFTKFICLLATKCFSNVLIVSKELVVSRK